MSSGACINADLLNMIEFGNYGSTVDECYESCVNQKNCIFFLYGTKGSESFTRCYLYDNNVIEGSADGIAKYKDMTCYKLKGKHYTRSKVALIYSDTLQSVKIESVKKNFCLKLPNSSRKSIKKFTLLIFTLSIFTFCKVSE